MVSCVTDTASEGGYDGYTRVLCLEGISAGGIVGTDQGPGIVVIYEGTLRINVKDRGYGVAA